MPWVRFDDSFTDHRKVKRLSDSAFRLHVSAVFWCTRHLTDGFVPADELGDVSDAKQPKRQVDQLVEKGLWNEEDGGWRIHDYLDYQPSRAKVEADREKRRQAGRSGGIRSGESRRGEANAKQDASYPLNPVPVPVPVPVPSRSGSVGNHPPVGDRAGARDDDPPPETDTHITELLRELTGRMVTADHASAVRRKLLDGRDIRNPGAYIAAAIRASPRDHLPDAGNQPPPVYALCDHGRDGRNCPFCDDERRKTG